MPDAATKQITEPYSARICVRFDGAPNDFNGTVYNQGDGDHALFYWPTQPATPERTELAEFRTQTKWVILEGKCTKGPFTDPDPKFIGMVSHAGYDLVRSDDRSNEYLSSDGIRCKYTIDGQEREVISSIEFKGAKIIFSEVEIGEQDAAHFAKPC